MEDEENEIDNCFTDNIFVINPQKEIFFQVLEEEQLIETSKKSLISYKNYEEKAGKTIDFLTMQNKLLNYDPKNFREIKITYLKESRFKISYQNIIFERGYMDFINLRKIILHNYPGSVVPPIPVQKQFILNYRQKELEYSAEEKTMILQYFINYIFGMPYIFESDIVKDFLDPYSIVDKIFERNDSPAIEDYVNRFFEHLYFYIGVEVPENMMAEIENISANVKSMKDATIVLAESIGQYVLSYKTNVLFEEETRQKCIISNDWSKWFCQEPIDIKIKLKLISSKFNHLLSLYDNFLNTIDSFIEGYKNLKNLTKLTQKTNLKASTASRKRSIPKVIEATKIFDHPKKKKKFVLNISCVHFLKLEYEKLKKDFYEEYVKAISNSLK